MKKFSLILLLTVSSVFCARASGSELALGFVNFKTCIEKSKHGQQETNALESLKKQMTEALEKTDKELEDLEKKLEDEVYMAGLTPMAENELKEKFQLLSQDYGRYQNQFYQLLNQANYNMLKTMHDEVSIASEKVRGNKKLALMLNEDSVLAHTASLDYTQAVIDELDKQFDLENPTAMSQEQG